MVPKPMLSVQDLESQAAFELPDRELMAFVTQGNALANVGVAVDVSRTLNNNHICVAIVGSCEA